MQANTVSQCIQVKSMLEPLLDKDPKENFSKAFDFFWKKFIEVVKPNPTLAIKINHCNANHQALKNMYEVS